MPVELSVKAKMSPCNNNIRGAVDAGKSILQPSIYIYIYMTYIQSFKLQNFTTFNFLDLPSILHYEIFNVGC